jgi:hypothetical protein
VKPAILPHAFASIAVTNPYHALLPNRPTQAEFGDWQKKLVRQQEAWCSTAPVGMTYCLADLKKG